MTRRRKSGEIEEAARGPQSAGRFAYDGLERTLHEKARLGIMTSLVAHPEGLRFNELKELCALTDGNLNRHLKVLEEDQLVEVWKGYSRNRPQTLVRITPVGRERFLNYVSVLEQVIHDAASVAKAQASHAPLPVAWDTRLGFVPG